MPYGLRFGLRIIMLRVPDLRGTPKPLNSWTVKPLNLLSQLENFKLFGFICLVYLKKFELLVSLVIGEERVSTKKRTPLKQETTGTRSHKPWIQGSTPWRISTPETLHRPKSLPSTLGLGFWRISWHHELHRPLTLQTLNLSKLRD